MRAVATFVALLYGAAVLTACGALLESALRYHGIPQYYGASLLREAVDRGLRLAGATRRQVLRTVQIEQAVLLGLALILGGTIAALTLVPMVKGATGSAAPYIPASGWLAVIGGTIVLGVTGTLLPIRRVLRIPPIEAVGLHE